jgi:hypothetical protein
MKAGGTRIIPLKVAGTEADPMLPPLMTDDPVFVMPLYASRAYAPADPNTAGVGDEVPKSVAKISKYAPGAGDPRKDEVYPLEEFDMIFSFCRWEPTGACNVLGPTLME